MKTHRLVRNIMLAGILCASLCSCKITSVEHFEHESLGERIMAGLPQQDVPDGLYVAQICIAADITFVFRKYAGSTAPEEMLVRNLMIFDDSEHLLFSKDSVRLEANEPELRTDALAQQHFFSCTVQDEGTAHAELRACKSVALTLSFEIDGKTAVEKLRRTGTILYLDSTLIQRIGGYYDFYETFTANDILCNIDSLKTTFTNHNAKVSSIWLWKGNYNMVFNGGWHTGAEIGFYNQGGRADASLIDSALLTLSDKTKVLFSRKADATAYWINGFTQGSKLPADLTLTAVLHFNNATDAESYCSAVNSGILGEFAKNKYFASLDRAADSVTVNAIRIGNTVHVIFE